ncbi:cupin domain-containing protein [Nonomuraea sp. NPDC049152]|uniref:cupin domain-containing protein n=1 Tax=Nonomuraea sp. NPDC049152 TaxID=3154350 RepID=UPI0033DE5E67
MRDPDLTDDTPVSVHDAGHGPVPAPRSRWARCPRSGRRPVHEELLRRISGGHSLELWRLRLPPHTAVDGVPHAPGTTEHLLVASGRLHAGPADDLRTLGAGDLLAFAGDAPHGYRTDDEPADVTVVIASPAIG